MRFKALTCAAAVAGAVLCHAQVSYLGLGQSGLNNKFVKVSDLGMSRTHDVFEGAQSSLRTYLPGAACPLLFSFRCSLDTSPEMDAWINSLLDGSYARRSGSIIFVRDDEPRMASFTDAMPIRWTAPECDSSSRKEGALILDVLPDSVVENSVHRGISGSVQKKWLPANFRLRIDGLDAACTRVNKIEAITIKQRCKIGAQLGTNLIGGDLDGDGLPDREVSDLVFTLPASAARPFVTWTVDATGPEIRRASIDYNDGRGVSIHRLSFDCCIVGVTEVLGTGMVRVRCAVSGNLVWSPRSN